VLLDLIPQERVHRLQRAGILRGDAHASAVVDLREVVRDRLFQPLHVGDAGRHLAVGRERFVEDAVGELACDLPQVRADHVTGRVVRGIRRLHADVAAGRREQEMMRGFVGVEPHCFVWMSGRVLDVRETRERGGEGDGEHPYGPGRHGQLLTKP